jgi:hypothetical protein
VDNNIYISNRANNTIFSIGITLYLSNKIIIWSLEQRDHIGSQIELSYGPSNRGTIIYAKFS